MSREGNVTFFGESGTEYQFTVYSADTEFNNIGAVYIFCKVSIDDELNFILVPLYIGETGKLGDRIANHEKWDCVNREGCQFICVKAISRREVRLDVETDLRHKYTTPCNEQ